MKEAITPKFIRQFKSKTSSFKTPVRATSVPKQTTHNKSEEKDSSNDVTCYYSVMWYVQHLRSLWQKITLGVQSMTMKKQECT